MDKLKGIRTFIAIAEHGSLTEASRHLDVSLPTVVRTLADLERQVGVTLVQRTTRHIRLSDEGRGYLEACHRVLAQLDDAEQALTAARRQPSGRLVVTSSVLFGRMHVAPVLCRFLQHHPAVSAELVLVDRVVDLVEEGIDVGVRIGPLSDSTLHATRVGQVRRVVCVSPDWLHRHGRPSQPGDLAHIPMVHFSGLGPLRLRRAAGDERSQEVAIAPRWSTNSVDAAIAAVCDGLGAGQFLSYMVEPLIGAGRLRRVLEDFEPPAVPVTVVYPHSRLLSAKVRAFVDDSTPELRARLAGAGSSSAGPARGFSACRPA